MWIYRAGLWILPKTMWHGGEGGIMEEEVYDTEKREWSKYFCRVLRSNKKKTMYFVVSNSHRISKEREGVNADAFSLKIKRSKMNLSKN